MTDEATKQASAEISKLVKEAKETIKKAEAIADEHGIGFSLNVTDEYGMGGYYRPKLKAKVDTSKEGEPDWDESDSSSGWQSSSHSC